MGAANGEQLLTITELADWLNVQPATIHAWRYRGEPSPPALKLGNRLRWRREDVERWLAERSDVAETPEPTPVGAGVQTGRPPGRADGRR